MEPAPVLLVDDQPERRAEYAAMLTDLGAQLVPADCEAQALECVRARDFAAVLLHLDRPALGGLQTASRIRHCKRSQGTPIIVIAASDEPTSRSGDDALGAVDFVSLPVVPQVLRSKVRMFIDLYHAHIDLTRSYQRLEAHLAERTHGLEQSNERLQAQIRERRRIESEREALLQREQALRAEAEELSRLKDEFLATMSHELRTPLNAIFGWITLLRTRQLDSATVERALETIERNARTQKRLIEDLLDVSRVVTGKVTLDLSIVDPQRIIETSVETMLPAAQAKSITLRTSLAGDVGVLHADSARLQQIVCNLLSNAIKFTPPQGRVEVSLARRASDAEISVRDNGQGIQPEFLPYVFDRFRQEDGSISRRHGGLGLGLAIVRHLSQLHGGTVTATSPGEGRGATFTVRVPIRSQAERAHRPARSGLGEAKRLAGVHVLVVDDDPGGRDVIAQILQTLGARVSLAASGESAFTLLLEHRPDVLVADLGMPQMDGYALIEQIRALDPQLGGRTPAVAVTAYASLEDRLRALRAGYQNHIAKPLEPEQFAAVITSLAEQTPHALGA